MCVLVLMLAFPLFLGTPKEINYNAVKSCLENIEGVVAAHSLHIWSLTVNKAALAVHLAIGNMLHLNTHTHTHTLTFLD